MKYLDQIAAMADRKSNYSNPVIDCQYTTPILIPTGLSIVEATNEGFQLSHMLEVSIRGKEGSFTRSYIKAIHKESVQ